MIEKIREYIEANQIFSQEGLVLVGVSGGADSVALLLILKDLGYHIQALHCNFHLRQEESDRDEQFVSELCKKNSIPLLIKNFDAKEYAVRNSISIEMAARDLRYKWFYEVQSQTNAQCIAVAHHKNDQAETLLLNLIRGTGIRGLAGMYPIRNKIARPLLCVTRQEVIDYLAQIKQAHVTDSTNMKKDATRNRIRMDILPLLAAINPNIINTLSETCSIMMSSIPFYDQAVQEELKQVKANDAELNIRALLESKNSAVIIYEWLKDKGFTNSQQTEIAKSLGSTSGKIWESKTHRLLKDRNKLILQENNKEALVPQIIQEEVDHISETGPGIAYFDKEKITSPITYRRAREGDWFIPFGMKGKKLISDYLTDVKATRFEKERQILALCGEDVIWVVGHRSDNRYRVDENTRRILRLRAPLPDPPPNGRES
ncbi:MAG: tRNA lysidine(34) synthetase TilS [Bacteroidaceae bacterium]|nr:tRNA lysidine(34) synthetase TilS [Bacteroidaceae bacterium]